MPSQSIPANKITFTLDLEDNLAKTDFAARYPDTTRQVLDLLDELGTSGTFFVVGKLARSLASWLEFIAEIAARGHEIAYHSHAHIPLDRDTPNNFRKETEADKAFIEETTGQPVVGYRAPVWSLVKETVWAVDALKELGFEYSSSVLPAPNPLYGQHCRRADGTLLLAEWIAGTTVAAGIDWTGYTSLYWRHLPSISIFADARHGLAHRIDRKSVLWTYCHPYDFDPGQVYVRWADGLGFVMSFLLWRNRGGTFRKMKKLLGNGTAFAFVTRVKSGEFENSIIVENLTI